MPVRRLPNLSPEQVVAVQDALLANADRLLITSLAALDLGQAALARSLAILGMEESGKAIAIHERRIQMAYAPEGEPFVTDDLSDIWAHHEQKLALVHRFLVEERYWFGVEPSDPAANAANLGTLKRWTRRHDNLKKRGFYVELDKVGDLMTPDDVADEESLGDVIRFIHQVGWQLRLGEHIEGKRQHEAEQGIPPASEEEVEHMRRALDRMDNADFVAPLLDDMRHGIEGKPLNNRAYRLPFGGEPYENLGRPGYEAETRELLRMMDELDQQDRARE